MFLPVVQIEGGWALDNSYDGDKFELDNQQLRQTDTYEIKFRVYSELNECYQFRTATITESDRWTVPMISIAELERIGALSPEQYQY
jgi:hypothetical protein